MNGKRVQVKLDGMDDRLLPDAGTALLLSNVEWDNEGAWQTMAGTFDVTTFTTGAITGLYMFNPRGNQRWLLAERRVNAETSEIVYVDWLSTGVNRGRAVQITTRRRLDSVQLGTQFAEYNGWVYFLSPVDSLVRWNGFRLAPVGFTTLPPAPRVVGPLQGFDTYDKSDYDYGFADVFHWHSGSPSKVFQRGVGEFPSGSAPEFLYGYATTEINDAGQESPPSVVVFASGQNATTTGKRILRLLMPRRRKGIRGVRLWRTKNIAGQTTPGQAVTLYLCEEFGHGEPFDWIDARPDAELGRQLDPDQFGRIPPGARAMAFWQGTCWLGGMPDTPTVLRYSTALYVEQFPEINTLPVGGASTGPIVALVPFLRGLAVFKEGGVYVVKGNPVDGFHVETVTEREGCAAPQAVENVPGVGLFFLSSTGPKLLVGTLSDEQPTQVVPVGAPISQFWRRKVGRNLRGSRSVYDPERREVWFAVPETGNPDPVNGLVYHVGIGKWSVRQSWPIGAMHHHRGDTFLGSWSGSLGSYGSIPGIHLLTRGSRLRLGGGANVSATIHANPLMVSESTRAMHLEIRGVPWGTANSNRIDVYTRVDKLPYVQQALNQTWQAAREDRPKWGTALWSATELWTDQDLGFMPFSIETEVGLLHEIRLGLNAREKIVDLILTLSDKGGSRPPERHS